MEERNYSRREAIKKGVALVGLAGLCGLSACGDSDKEKYIDMKEYDIMENYLIDNSNPELNDKVNNVYQSWRGIYRAWKEDSEAREIAGKLGKRVGDHYESAAGRAEQLVNGNKIDLTTYLKGDIKNWADFGRKGEWSLDKKFDWQNWDVVTQLINDFKKSYNEKFGRDPRPEDSQFYNSLVDFSGKLIKDLDRK